MLDRLLHLTHVVQIEGKSHRLRNKLKAGVKQTTSVVSA